MRIIYKCVYKIYIYELIYMFVHITPMSILLEGNVTSHAISSKLLDTMCGVRSQIWRKVTLASVAESRRVEECTLHTCRICLSFLAPLSNRESSE